MSENYKPPTMGAKELRTEIWKIVSDELKRSHYSVYGRGSTEDRINKAMEAMKKRVNELLDKQEAILVYQP